MGNPAAVSIQSLVGLSPRHTLLRLIAVEVPVVDNSGGFAYRDCCNTDDRLQHVRCGCFDVRGIVVPVRRAGRS
jgi:hypothetical protein